MTILKLWATDCTVCYHIARDEAERYQELMSRMTEHGRATDALGARRYAILQAKRDACSRIARLIRFGGGNIGPDVAHSMSRRKRKNGGRK